ncbi:MAG: PIG-L family deacetylase [Bryobacterales bacterium]|nr:PIG-L family deacetylase [Bryobacterales bacterium]
MRILHIHAHPDDAEIFTGGTLALLKQLGHHVTICSMTPGDCGSKEYSAEVVADMRRKEAAKGAGQIGADYICGEFRDLAIFVDDASRRRVTAIFRKVRPDLVLTASPIDYHCDHEATSRLAVDACFAAPAPNYDTAAYGDDAAIDAIPHLYFVDPAEGTDRECRPQNPHFVVDITSVLDRKRDMLACHESQRRWLQQHHGMDDFLETMERWSAARGKYVGVPYGEGFRQYKMHPYPTTPLLEELLGDRVHKI